MKSPLSNKQFKIMLSYFLLAIMVIVAYKFIMEINIFLNSIKWLLNVVSPFIMGFLLAYVLNIPCSSIQRLLIKSKYDLIRKGRKIISILVAYLMLFIFIFLFFKLIVPSIYRNISLFITDFNNYYKSAQDFIDYINSLDILSTDVSIDKILIVLREFTFQKFPSSLNALFSFSTGLLNGFLTLISSLYILLEKDNFKKYLNRVMKVFLPSGGYTIILKYAQRLNINFKQYIYTQTIDGCILGGIATIELFLLKSPYALALGIMLGIVNYIPYFGSIFGSILTVMLVAFTQGLTTAAVTGVILLITQQIDANIIQPRLMSGSFSLSPLLVIISITIGGAISGILGMVVAIPIVSVVKEILEELITYYEKRKSSEGNDTE